MRTKHSERKSRTILRNAKRYTEVDSKRIWKRTTDKRLESLMDTWESWRSQALIDHNPMLMRIESEVDNAYPSTLGIQQVLANYGIISLKS